MTSSDRERMLPFASAGGAKPIAATETDAGCRAAAWGGLEGVPPPHRFKARTAASDGQRAFTRAARSAGLNFAVRSLSEASGRENTLREGERVRSSPHPPRSGPPSPQGEGQLLGLIWA